MAGMTKPSRRFIMVCCLYFAAVAVAFVFGLAEKDADGVSFIPTIIITLPWFFVPSIASFPDWLFSFLTAFYDLPLFLFSALLNVGIAKLIRRFYIRTSD